MNEKFARVLTAKGRRQIAEKNFALPGGRYPIHDRSHARNALARASQHGTSAEQASIRAAVSRKYPGIGVDKTAQVTSTMGMVGGNQPMQNLSAPTAGGLGGGLQQAGSPKVKPLAPSMKHGGNVKKTGIYKLHKGEKVIPANKVKKSAITKEVLAAMRDELGKIITGVR